MLVVLQNLWKTSAKYYSWEEFEKDRIFTELFEASPADVDYSTLQGNVAITLQLNGKIHTFESARNQTLLKLCSFFADAMRLTLASMACVAAVSVG